MELRGLCGRRAEPPIQTDTSNKTVREDAASCKTGASKNAVFESPQKVNKLNEEGSILNEIDAQPNPNPEQIRYIWVKNALGLPASTRGGTAFFPKGFWPAK
jgi:hypothetical protein